MSFFNLPDLGEGLHEIEIIKWHISVNDPVEQDQVLASVETAKAIVEIQSPQTGTIRQLFGVPGDTIQVGEPFVEFTNEGDNHSEPDQGSVVGKIEVGDIVVAETPLAVTHPNAMGSKATPAVRAMARTLNVDLALVKPSGKNNAVTAGDVQRVANLIREAGEMIPLKGARRTMAIAMSQANSEVVPVTICDDADIQGWRETEDTTTRLIRAIAQSCKAEPALNAWFDNHAIARILHDKVDLGIAVDSEHGLFVPVLRNVEKRDVKDLRRGLKAIKEAVRGRSIPVESMRGYTITLSNFGMFAGRYADPIVIPPSVAIVGAGKIRNEVVAANGQFESHATLPLSLTFDHRAATGGEAARFMAALIADLEGAE